MIKSEYDQVVQDRATHDNEHTGPFMSMKDQMAYVNQVKKMHQEEIYNF